jgi:hypothetical protein
VPAFSGDANKARAFFLGGSSCGKISPNRSGSKPRRTADMLSSCIAVRVSSKFSGRVVPRGEPARCDVLHRTMLEAACGILKTTA